MTSTSAVGMGAPVAHPAPTGSRPAFGPSAGSRRVWTRAAPPRPGEVAPPSASTVPDDVRAIAALLLGAESVGALLVSVAPAILRATRLALERGVAGGVGSAPTPRPREVAVDHDEPEDDEPDQEEARANERRRARDPWNGRDAAEALEAWR